MNWVRSKESFSLVVIAIVGSCWQLVSGNNSFSFLLLLSILAVLIVSVILGSSFLGWIYRRKEFKLDLLQGLLSGVLILSFLLFTLAFLSPFEIHINFLIICFLAGFSFSILNKNGLRATLFISNEGLVALGLVLIGSTLLSGENLKGLSFIGGDVVTNSWQDIFYHATQVSLFAHSQGAAKLVSPLLKGESIPPYHYGSYLISSLLVKLSGVDAFSLTTGFYAPFGTFLFGLSAYVFGSELVSPLAGVFAVIGILLVPDPSFYYLGTPWTSYHFFQQVGIGGAYAVAFLGLAWTFLIRSCTTKRYLDWCLSIIFLGLTGLFKVQIFVTYSYTFAVFSLIFFLPLKTRYKMVGLAFGSAGFVFVMNVLRSIPRAPTLELSTAGALANLRTIVSSYPSSGLSLLPLLKGLLDWSVTYPRQIFFGVPLISLAIYGMWVLILAPAMRIASEKKLPKALILFPVAILVNHWVIALCFACNQGYGDLFEMIHKTFVWPYFAVIVSVASFLAVKWNSKWNVIGCFVIPVLIAITAYQGSNIQKSLMTRWGMRPLEFPLGLYETAVFLRSHSHEDAIVQYSENDSYLIFAGLSERSAYVAHHMINAPPLSDKEKSRFSEIEALLKSDTRETATARAKSMGIEWLVLNRQVRGALPLTQFLVSQFDSGGFQVFRF